MTIKRITFVLHIPKTGGSSFWLDLAESASGNPKIAITDSQHEALSRGEPLSSAWGHTIRMVNGFARIEQRHLLMHVHYPMGNFKVIAPQAQYVVLFREPRARLRSAYRHWMGEQSARTKTPNPMEFFQAFHSQGLNYYLSRLVSDTDQWYSEPSSELIKFLRKSFIFISFNEYINNGDKLRDLEKELEISPLKIHHYPKTVTDLSYNDELDELLNCHDDFKLNFDYQCYWETLWHERIGLKD